MVDISLNICIFNFIFQDIVKYMTDMTDYPQYMIQETVLSIRMGFTKFRFGTTGNRRFPESCNTSATAKRPFSLFKCTYLEISRTGNLPSSIQI
jgi:hypothetical protein